MIRMLVLPLLLLLTVGCAQAGPESSPEPSASKVIESARAVASAVPDQLSGEQCELFLHGARRAWGGKGERSDEGCSMTDLGDTARAILVMLAPDSSGVCQALEAHKVPATFAGPGTPELTETQAGTIAKSVASRADKAVELFAVGCHDGRQVTMTSLAGDEQTALQALVQGLEGLAGIK